MSEFDFSRFDDELDLEELAQAIDASEKGKGGNGDFKDVPLGNYEAKIDKLELSVSKLGKPMLTCWFKILAGEFKNSRLFMNQVIEQGFQIHIANDFLRSLDSGLEIKFKTFKQYEQMVMDVAESIDGLEYAVKYGETSKGFKTFEITDVFETE